MNRFDNFVNRYLHRAIFHESVVDIARDSLDSTVFQTFDDGRLPIFKDAIKKQILTDINRIESVIPIVNFFVIGSVLTKNYTEKSDIDVNVQIDAEAADVIATSEILHLMERLNGNLASNTTHPINYFIVTSDFDLDKTEAAYDVANERWLKAPDEISPDILSFVSRIRGTFENIDISTGELRRELIDLTELKDLKTGDLRKIHVLIQKKIDEINESMKQIVNVYHNIKMLRTMAFDRVLTPNEIKVYGNQNRLPENIIYKLLEKYYYIKFMKELKALVDDKERVDYSNVKDVEKATKNFLSK
jgi:predicted nucleotidyltransferase